MSRRGVVTAVCSFKRCFYNVREFDESSRSRHRRVFIQKMFLQRPRIWWVVEESSPLCVHSKDVFTTSENLMSRRGVVTTVCSFKRCFYNVWEFNESSRSCHRCVFIQKMFLQRPRIWWVVEESSPLCVHSKDVFTTSENLMSRRGVVITMCTTVYSFIQKKIFTTLLSRLWVVTTVCTAVCSFKENYLNVLSTMNAFYPKQTKTWPLRCWFGVKIGQLN
jgi:ABC-type transport system involved in cytochrome c biogenesis ATPase subunit